MRNYIAAVALFSLGAAGAHAFDGINLPSTRMGTADSIIGFEMGVKGNISKFFHFKLSDGGVDILHGFQPQEGETVQWYARGVKCDEPEKSCEFELAIRRPRLDSPRELIPQ